MANKSLLPINGTTSNGLAVKIEESALGHLIQIGGWGDFDSSVANMLAENGLSLPSDYRSPGKQERGSVWRIAPGKLLVRTGNPLDLASLGDLVSLDLSHSRFCFTLSGPGASTLLSRVIAIDMAEEGFGVGTFVQTAIHHVSVLVERSSKTAFEVFVPITFGRSLLEYVLENINESH